MQPNSGELPSDHVDGGHDRSLKGTADDYIQLLVGRIADDAGSAQTATVVGGSHVAEVQRHLDELRHTSSERSEDDDVSIAMERQPASLGKLERNEEDGETDLPSTIPSGNAPTYRRASTPDVAAAEAVILEAVSAVGGEPQPFVEQSSNRYDSAAVRRHRTWPYVIVLLLVTILVGVSVTSRSFIGEVTALLETYWAEEAGAIQQAATNDDRDVAQPTTTAPGEIGAPLTTLEAGATNQIVKRRTVRTYRVGADGAIVFGPRIAR